MALDIPDCCRCDCYISTIHVKYTTDYYHFNSSSEAYERHAKSFVNLLHLAGMQQPFIQRRELIDLRSRGEPLRVGELQVPLVIAQDADREIPALTIGASMMGQSVVTPGEGIAATLGRERLSHSPRPDLAGIVSAPATFAVAHTALEELDTSRIARCEIPAADAEGHRPPRQHARGVHGPRARGMEQEVA